MFYNQWEIQEIVANAKRVPQLRPYADYLAQWVEIVNGHSDGWPYWTAGSRAAEKLTAFLKGAGMLVGRTKPFSDNEMRSIRKMLSPIKSIATRHEIPAPVLHDETSPEYEDPTNSTPIVRDPVFISSQSEANSYGVRCYICGEWETQCTC